jgi:hypothetical protein
MKEMKMARPPILGIALVWTFLEEGTSTAPRRVPSHAATGVNAREREKATRKVKRMVVIDRKSA